MTRIAPSDRLVTLVNIFRLRDPADQQRLLDVLIDATETTMRHQPGYISANLHRSLDGTHVVNYAQWRSTADFEAMLSDPQAREHMARAAQLAGFEPHLYEVVYSDDGPAGG
jgi:quinol monooxygenase YgiN